MLAPETSHDLPMPADVPDDRHIVVELRLSGPIVHEAESALPSAEVAELRDRVAALERALAGVDARIEALSHVFSAAVEHFASVQPPPREPTLAVAAAPPAAPARPPVRAPAHTPDTVPPPVAVPAPFAPALASSSGSRSSSSRPSPRGLRRMASVLRHR